MQGSVCSAVSHTAARPHWPAGGTGTCRISLRQQVSRYSQQRLPPRGTCDLRPSDRWRSTGGVRTTVRTEPAATARYGVTRLAAGAASCFSVALSSCMLERGDHPDESTRPARQVQGQIAYDDWTMIRCPWQAIGDRQLAMGGSGVGVGAAPRAPLPRAQPPTETHDYETTFLIVTIVVHSREPN